MLADNASIIYITFALICCITSTITHVRMYTEKERDEKREEGDRESYRIHKKYKYIYDIFRDN